MIKTIFFTSGYWMLLFYNSKMNALVILEVWMFPTVYEELLHSQITLCNLKPSDDVNIWDCNHREIICKRRHDYGYNLFNHNNLEDTNIRKLNKIPAIKNENLVVIFKHQSIPFKSLNSICIFTLEFFPRFLVFCVSSFILNIKIVHASFCAAKSHFLKITRSQQFLEW